MMDGYLSLEQLFAALPAQWIWKEGTNRLELVSLHSTAESKGKKSLARVRAILDPVNEALEKSKYGISRRSFSIMTKSGSVGQVLAKLSESHKLELRQNQFVTLEDVKNAAFILLGENDLPDAQKRFRPMLRTQQLNEFLMALLNYFSVFLGALGLDSKSKELLTNAGSPERVEAGWTKAKKELTQRHMARTYSALLLGLDSVELHHMACGKAMGSATHKDRQLFECLYAYSIYVAWVTFGRKNMDLIRDEIGRLLRSDIFNPAPKVKDEEMQTEHRGFPLKRPPISSIVTQRSPVLRTLLQSPREKSIYLFRQHPVNPGSRIAQEDERTSVMDIDPSPTHLLGIIGEPLSKFLPDTLVPIESHLEEEEEKEDKEEEDLPQKSLHSLTELGDLSLGPESFQSHAMAISRATTTATESDYNLVQ
ncbi:protein phosphatase 1 regulatory subunit 36 [Mobula birostris]|uniref:protein phosphatase 1 regulatory subunit 36 n=1 Tax=Mobula birostris TaxID=1983395 RepID=UPI003B27B37E